MNRKANTSENYITELMFQSGTGVRRYVPKN